MNNFIVGISTGNKDVEMSAGEIECSVLNSEFITQCNACLLYTSPSPRDRG